MRENEEIVVKVMKEVTRERRKSTKTDELGNKDVKKIVFGILFDRTTSVAIDESCSDDDGTAERREK